MAKARGVSATQPLPVTTRSTRQALKERTNTPRKQIRLYEDDGDTEDLVRDAKRQRGGRRRIIQPDLDIVMTGGLGLGSEVDKENANVVLPVASLELKPDAKKSDTLRSTSNPGRKLRGSRKMDLGSAQQQVLAEVEKGMENTARAQVQQQATSLSEKPAMAESDDVPDEVYATLATRRIDSISPSPPRHAQESPIRGARSSMLPPGSVLKFHGTPAMESSMLALKNFKRRPRQPSMLQMVQQRTTSTRSPTTHAPASEGSSEFDFDLGGVGDDAEDEFAPDAEGTPLKSRDADKSDLAEKSTPSFSPPVATLAMSSESRQKRKSDEMSSSSSLLRSRRKKKLRSSSTTGQSTVTTVAEVNEMRKGQSSDGIVLSPADPALTIEVLHSSPPSSPPYNPLPTTRRVTTPDRDILVASSWKDPKRHHVDHSQESVGALDGALAMPLSSSPVPGSRPIAIASNESVGRTKSRQPQPSTANLQSRVPKQRRKLEPRQKKTSYDIPSDSDEESVSDASALDGDEDELSATMPTRRRRASTVTKRTHPVKVAASTRKPRATPKKRLKLPPSHKKTGKTYRRQKDKDKDNEVAYESSLEESAESTVADVSLTMLETAKTQELEEAKRKFAEIDDWDMEFESQSAENHRSSSVGWR